MLSDYCRFYWKPIQTLRTRDIYQAVMDHIQSNSMTLTWMESHEIGVLDHPTIIHMKLQISKVLEAVDQCIETYGHDYVFLRYKKIEEGGGGHNSALHSLFRT
jgi:hypothetical protein